MSKSEQTDTIEIRNVYLLFGEEAFLRNRYKDAVLKNLLPSGDTTNFSRFEGKGVNFNEIIDLAETMPFFAERRVILIENSDLFNETKEEIKAFSDYLANVPQTTVLVFCEEKVSRAGALYKAAAKNGFVKEFAPIKDDKQLKDYIVGRLSKEHRPITGRALEVFMQMCGNDLTQINCELDKLVSYTFGKDGIRPEDVTAICSPKLDDKIFAMMEAMFRRDVGEALSYYADLIALKVNPNAILATIEGQYTLIRRVKEMDAEHIDYKSIAGALKANEYRVKKSLPLARRSSKIWIMRGLTLCAEVEEKSKSGGLDIQIGLESLIIDLSREKG